METGPESGGRGGTERQAWQYITEAVGHYCICICKYTKSPCEYGHRCTVKLDSAAVCRHCFLCRWKPISKLFSIFWAGSIVNALSPWSQSNQVIHRPVRKLGVSTQLRVCKDYCRCRDHYLHGYRILQHQVQIKFLEAPFASLALPWMQGCGSRSFGSKRQEELQLQLPQCVLSQLAFFHYKLLTSNQTADIFITVISRVFTRSECITTH